MMNEECKVERTHPWTSAELFIQICGILKEKGLMPEKILDYVLPASPPLEITTDKFRLCSDFRCESNGIYLDVLLIFEGAHGVKEFNTSKALNPFALITPEDTKPAKGLGTFKALDSSNEAMRSMTNLFTGFDEELKEYRYAHKSDFIWDGFDVCPCDGSGIRDQISHQCHDMKLAMEIKDILLEKYPIVEVTDYRARTVVAYKKEDLYCLSNRR